MAGNGRLSYKELLEKFPDNEKLNGTPIGTVYIDEYNNEFSHAVLVKGVTKEGLVIWGDDTPPRTGQA